ncbi:hypothetical protein QYF36_020838 [Acer negundo]|nr:hypothetical protein QYF36_020838 [Acer negundo]
MSWSSKSGDKDWLRKCAVGVIRTSFGSSKRKQTEKVDKLAWTKSTSSFLASDNSPSSNSMKSQSAKTVQHFEEDPPDSVSYAEQSQEDPVCDFIEGDMGRGM